MVDRDMDADADMEEVMVMAEVEAARMLKLFQLRPILHVGLVERRAISARIVPIRPSWSPRMIGRNFHQRRESHMRKLLVGNYGSGVDAAPDGPYHTQQLSIKMLQPVSRPPTLQMLMVDRLVA